MYIMVKTIKSANYCILIEFYMHNTIKQNT